MYLILKNVIKYYDDIPQTFRVMEKQQILERSETKLNIYVKTNKAKR